MMKITRIVGQERQKGRYSIFVDDTYSFSLSETTLLESGLAPGRELTKDELKAWKLRSTEDKAYAAVLRYAAVRQRSVGEMVTYLKRKAVSPALAESILNKLTKIGLLDDGAFARSFVASRRLLRPTSKRKLQHLLRAKQVSGETIEQALASDTALERSVLRDLIARKRDLPKYREDKLKFMQYLARQGFTYDDIQSELHDSEGA